MSYYGSGGSMTGYYGDPSFWGAIKGAVGGAVTGFATGGGPWGALAGAVIGGVSGSHGTGSAAAASSAPMPGGSFVGPTRLPGIAGAVGRVTQFARGHPVLSGAAAAGTAAITTGAVELLSHRAGAVTPGGVGLRGYHMTKPHVCGGQVIASHLAKNRRMNVFNPRALRRAARRAHGFLRMSRKLVRYYTPKAHKGRAYIHARRKRA